MDLSLAAATKYSGSSVLSYIFEVDAFPLAMARDPWTLQTIPALAQR